MDREGERVWRDLGEEYDKNIFNVKIVLNNKNAIKREKSCRKGRIYLFKNISDK